MGAIKHEETLRRQWLLPGYPSARGHPINLKTGSTCMEIFPKVLVITNIMEKWKKVQEKKNLNTFKCTLGHPVDLSARWGSQQTIEYHKQQWYQEEHGVRTSELHSAMTASKPEESTWNEWSLQRMRILSVVPLRTWYLVAFCNCQWSPSSWLFGLPSTLWWRASVSQFTWGNNRCLELSLVYIESLREH